MARVVIFDEGATPNKYLRIISSIASDDPIYINRTDAIINPDLSLLEGIVDSKYWKHENGKIVEMTQEEKNTLDSAQALEQKLNTRQAVIAVLNAKEGRLLKAALLVILDEMNLQHNTNRTPTQFLDAIVAKIDNGDVD